MTSKNLLLCFDAFGTLFKPKYPIAQQYGDVARSLGLTSITNEDVNASFKAAFKQESKLNPNYGKRNGLNAEKWWARIVTNTFTPLVPASHSLPPELVPKLLYRFWSDEGYVLFPDVLPLIRRIRAAHKSGNTKVIVGVITNSDDRVPDILMSLGMRVSPLRYPAGDRSRSTEDYDIDFSVMSYDVGYEKPDRKIFEAAERMLGNVLGEQETDLSEWRKVYVGDEHAKDVVGAVGAGWNAILVDREASGQESEVAWLDQEPAQNLFQVFEAQKAIGFRSLERLAEWLPEGA